MQAYLDNAATTKMDDEVIDFMHQIMSTHYGNPSSIYESGRQSRVIVEEARITIARLLNVSPAEIFFTSGGTESINTIISGVLQNNEVERVITSPIEHSAVFNSLEFYCKQYNKSVEYLTVDANGLIDLQELDELLKNGNGKALVSLMHINNELGNILPIDKVSHICKNNNALFFSDTVQSMGKLELDFSSDLLDFAVASAHKFHGPKGIGFMYINGNNKLTPFIIGGSQERNMRAGTENISAIAAMAKAFELSCSIIDETSKRVLELKKYLIHKLKNDFPEISFNGDVNSISNILNIGIPKSNKNEMYLMKLDINGVYVSGGSACSSGAIKDSHVIKAIGKNELIRPIRLALSKYTKKEEIDYFLKMLKKL